MTGNHLNDISKVYLDKVAEFNTDKAASDVKRWEELGGPTPQNYRPNDDSAKIKQEGYKGTADLSKADPEAKKKVEDRIEKWAGKRVPGGKKGVKESFYDWRKDIFEAGDPGANVNPTFPGGEKQGLKGSKEGEKIKEKAGICNKVIISPKISEVVQAMGGELIEAKEVECDCEDCGQDPCVKCGESHHNIQEGDVYIKSTYGSPVVKPKKKKSGDTGVKNKKQLDAIRSFQTASFKPPGEQLDELDIGGALNKASTSFNKSQNPVVKTIRSVLAPVKGNTGRGTMTKQDQRNVIKGNIKEGEEVKEGLGAAVVGGALATGLAIKGIQAAKKVHDNLKSGKGSIGKSRQKTSDALKQMMNQSYEPEGEMIEAKVVGEAKIDDVKYSKSEKLKDHSKDVHLTHANPGVRQDRNKRRSASDVIFHGHSKVERDRKQAHYKSRGVKTKGVKEAVVGEAYKKKKKHNCASKVKHEEYGMGNCIPEMHTLDEDGNVTHYDVMFESKIVKNIPVSSLEIIEGKFHEHYINYEKNVEVMNERLGGKGYSRKAAGSGIHKTSGDWPDSDRGAGNKAKRRAGKKVEKKSPTYLAHVHNKESYTLTNADKVANTPAYQNFKKGMKDKDGKPLYKLAPHLKELALAKEDRALEIVRANIIKKHGKGAIYDPKNPPKASPQPKRKPEKDTRSAAQREVDAQYGRTPWNKKGSLGT